VIDENNHLDPSWLRSRYFVPLVLLGLTVAMFAAAVLSPSDAVLSSLGTDLSEEFIYWRQFGFEQLHNGHLALWNPHVFSGVAFMGDFQSALLYPPNWIYLCLPLTRAVNLEIALHVFLLGWFMSMWTKHYGVHPLSVLFASAMMMFGGAYFFHITPGYLSVFDAMVWIPLILVTIEKVVEDPEPKWVLIGIFALTMQILSGHPQTTFNTIVACGLYGAMRLREAPRVLVTFTAIAIIGIGATAIGAIQMWTGLQAASEGTRQNGLPYGVSAMFSFPPENFLTFLFPYLFGNLKSVPYWGRCYLWEMCPYLGITGLSMAILGATVKFPQRMVWLTMVFLLFVLALGDHTPLFAILYYHLPGFNGFRSHSKFLFEAALFLAMLAAIGTDHLLRSPRGAKVTAIIMLVAGVVTGMAALGFSYATALPSIAWLWQSIVSTMAASEDFHMPRRMYVEPVFLASSRGLAVSEFLIAAGIFLVLAVLTWLRTIDRRAAYILIAVGIAEVFVFAHSTLSTFHLADTDPRELREFVASHPGDYRIVQLPRDSNRAMIANADDIWGYDPTVSSRYAQFIGFSQHESPDQAGPYTKIWNMSPLLRLIRLRYVFRGRDGNQSVREIPGALPHLLLVNDWKRVTDRDSIFNALIQPSFEPDKTVILETDPDPRPVAARQPGTVELLSNDTNSLTISASVEAPTLLMITDAYSRYFRAVPLQESSQRHYDVLPADYTLMVVPLAAGKHFLRLEYAPSGYVIGRWISLAALLAYVVAVGLYFRSSMRRLPTDAHR
jgi:hypothetical protein